MDRRTALLTGCSASGLGSELACALDKLGWTVVATARDPATLEHLEQIGIHCIQLDVVSPVSIEHAATSVQHKLDGAPLDMLVNNAGAGTIGPVMDSHTDTIHDIFNLNVFSIIAVTKAFLPLLQASSRPLIVNHSSLGSIFATPSLGVYNASKSAVAMLTRVLRMELHAQGISVVELKTGRVQSRFFQNAVLRTEKHSSGSSESPLQSLDQTTINGFTVDAAAWASQVAMDLSQKHPPNEIWRGGGAYVARLANLLPTWIVDWGASAMIKVSSIDQNHKTA